MKLASLKNGTRDGELIVVSQDLQYFTRASSIPTMQYALENWNIVGSQLKKIYNQLNQNKDKGQPFKAEMVHSPLPRAYQWLDGSVHVNHVELVRKSRGAELPESFWTDPLMYQGGSDSFAGPRDPILVRDETWGIDFESEVAIITDDVPMGVTPEDAISHIKLILLVNDVSLRNLVPAELAKGFGFIHGKPATSFSPVAITPDELETAWKDCKVHLLLYTYVNGKEFGHPNAGVDMAFSYAQLISHAAKTRFLSAGTIIGGGTVSNRDQTVGSSCIVERRMMEKIEKGHTTTPFLCFGDQVKIEMLDKQGQSIFGSIEQIVKEC